MPMHSLNQPVLVEIKKQAGVKAPEFVYLELLEEGVL
jgi:hypothetical protein